MRERWPENLPVAQVRVARPTSRLKEVVRFYGEAIGLKIVGSFEGHAGYSGVMLGLPGYGYHLEFTEHEQGSPCPAPTRDNLLVFYIPDEDAFEKLVARLASFGHHPVEPENPYWLEQAVTIEDPDGWRVVLVNNKGIGE
ncbi:MAG TPA: VOC family protein [Blastocatellia bacterium]|nr:VOC family protein [Blastocatellia bacterium]